MNSTETPILIHIGYPKTGSTWLQSSVFSNENSGFCVPWKGAIREGFAKGLCTDAITQFVECSPFDPESTQQVFQTGLETAAKSNLIPVISNEFLSGGFAVYPKNYYQGLEKDILLRLHRIFPEAKILMVIREQKSILISAYKEYVKRGGTLKIKQFLTSIARLKNLKFDLLIEEYIKNFGVNNLLVLPFEELKKDQKYFCKRLFDFVDLPEVDLSKASEQNVGFQGGRLSAQRLVNYIFPPQNNLGYKLSTLAAKVIPNNVSTGIESNLKKEVVEHIGDYFLESNQRTSNLIGINLGNLKYDV